MSNAVTEPILDGGPFDRTEQLFALMDAKKNLLAELRNLATSQTESIDRQDVTELLHLLARKEGLMGRLLALQTQLQSFQGEDPNARIWSSIERRRACQEVKRICDQWIQEILVMEQRAADRMTAQRDAIAGQLVQSNDSMRLARAYGVEGENLLSDSEGSVSFDG